MAGSPSPLGLGWPYWILDTDYESYTSVYSCASFGLTGLKYEYAWLLTRDQVPSEEAVSSIHYLYTLNVDTFLGLNSKYRVTNQAVLQVLLASRQKLCFKIRSIFYNSTFVQELTQPRENLLCHPV